MENTIILLIRNQKTRNVYQPNYIFTVARSRRHRETFILSIIFIATRKSIEIGTRGFVIGEFQSCIVNTNIH